MIDTQTLFYIIGSAILALFLALFQYIYKAKGRRIEWVLTGLRFISLFCILLLIVNPKFDKSVISNIKPKLVIAADNSQSIMYLNKDSLALLALKTLQESNALNKKFDVKAYSFGKQLNQSPALNFEEPQTNITKCIQDIESIYESQQAPIVLISDGNQSIGTSYEYASNGFNQAIYPLVLGNKTTYTDLKIEQINVNKYVYLNNKFPLEIITSYTGDIPVSSELIIRSNTQIVYRERLSFSEKMNSKISNPILKTSKVGLQSYQVSLSPIETEKNTQNNFKSIGIETIDEFSKVAIIATISHPDIGSLKTSIESNKQRKVELLTPEEYRASKAVYSLVVLYQPNLRFNAVFERIKKLKTNSFIIGGTHTDWRFLNTIQSDFYQEITGQNEVFQAQINPEYNNYNIEKYNFSAHPPLTSEFGSVKINSRYSPLFYKTNNGVISSEPLWFTFENDTFRTSLLLAENLWKWRLHSYQDDQSFENFDSFIAKLIQYLDVKNKKERLMLDYEAVYDGSQNMEMTAQYFNKNYEFDANASITVLFKNINNSQQFEFPMLNKSSVYSLDLNTLEPGTYTFKVRVNKGEYSSSGTIKILNFNIEQQFLNANIAALEQLAKNTNTKMYLDIQINQLIAQLISDNRFYIVQKVTKKSVSLLELKFCLLLLMASLASEWLLRKYNGLI